jgi:hypothetical protein
LADEDAERALQFQGFGGAGGLDGAGVFVSHCVDTGSGYPWEKAPERSQPQRGCDN